MPDFGVETEGKKMNHIHSLPLRILLGKNIHVNSKIIWSGKCCERRKPRGIGSREEAPNPAWKQSRGRKRKE